MHWIRLIFGFAACLGLAFIRGNAETADLDPGAFKAAILSKIPPYISWPKESFPADADEFVIGILGEVPFKDMLVELTKRSHINGKTSVVKYVNNAEEISKCQMLFIPQAQYKRWEETRQTMKTFGILTVTEQDKFPTDSGVILNLLVDQRVLEINVRNARDAGLSINSQLLRVAKIVK